MSGLKKWNCYNEGMRNNMPAQQIKNDLTTILDYLWRDEKKHYSESKYRKNHIFLVLKRLKAEISEQ